MADVPVATIDATGLRLPTYDEGLTYFQSSFRSIYGEDVNLEASTQDGQFMALLALALKNTNDSVAAAYNAFSPSTAQGAGLSSVVKINGLVRKAPSRSTVEVRIVGQAGASLLNGVVGDDLGQRWSLPASVLIPLSGEIVVTAVAVELGAVQAPAGTITTFVTIQAGFQSVSNPDAAIPGQPVERDPALKARQAISTSIPAQTPIEGLMGAVFALPGVTRARGYENDTDLVDADGIPSHAIAVVVEGGDAATLAALIAAKKTPGVGTYGDTLIALQDAYGIPHPIRFFRPTVRPVAWYLKVRPLRGYSKDVEAQIQQSLADWTNALGLGNRLPLNRAYTPANLRDAPASSTYEILELKAQADSYAPPSVPVDLECAFNEVFACAPDDVSIVPVLN